MLLNQLQQNRAILRAAQEAAVKEINALKYLNNQQKHDYITDITRDFDEPNGLRKERTIADVATILGKAKEADAKAHLELVKHEARKTVQGLKYLTKEQS
ncbi:GA module-containing protein [Enterococcus cecorum]|uniref:GA module-containing protein n=1 Tax=Enterococcus cecorum TaxID=44008 RepID=UPI000DEACF2E|nr:GA module-containing protein [Enterococcus cecorum]